jgi:hypothetical protein
MIERIPKANNYHQIKITDLVQNNSQFQESHAEQLSHVKIARKIGPLLHT